MPILLLPAPTITREVTMPPEPSEIVSKRKSCGLSASKAARLVHVDPRTWRRWEAGDREMPEAAWELFLLKAGGD